MQHLYYQIITGKKSHTTWGIFIDNVNYKPQTKMKKIDT